MKRSTRTRLLVLSIAVLFLTGCIGGLSSRGGTAKVGVYITDTGIASSLSTQATALTAEVTEVWVTIIEVEAKIDGKRVKLFDVPEEQQHVNLMDLQFKQELLGGGNLPAGAYKEIRFKVKPNEDEVLHNYVVVSGEQVALKVPSNELKPDINITIEKDTIVDLVFDVNEKYFSEPNGSYNANPKKVLRFVESFHEEYGGISGEVKLWPGVSDWLSIEINLFREGQSTPIWHTVLMDDVIQFEIGSLQPGVYRLEAEINFLDIASARLESDPIVLGAGQIRSVSLQK